MKRMVFLLTLTLGLGILIGALGDRLVGAQQTPVTRTELVRKDLGGLAGYEGIMYLLRSHRGRPPGSTHTLGMSWSTCCKGLESSKRKVKRRCP
jgi:hypothetical protein